MSLMEKFANPETFDSLSFGEKMTGSTITMIMGMGITFVVLILLWIFISLMGKALKSSGSKKETAAPAAAPAPAPAKAENLASDEELVAVITAAIAAYEGSSNKLVVRKITRISGEQTPWGVSAIKEQMATREL